MLVSRWRCIHSTCTHRSYRVHLPLESTILTIDDILAYVCTAGRQRDTSEMQSRTFLPVQYLNNACIFSVIQRRRTQKLRWICSGIWNYWNALDICMNTYKVLCSTKLLRKLRKYLDFWHKKLLMTQIDNFCTQITHCSSNCSLRWTSDC